MLVSWLQSTKIALGQFFSQNYNCNYTLFNQLPKPEDDKGTIRSSSQAATCLAHTADFTVEKSRECQFVKVNYKNTLVRLRFHA